MEVWKEYLEKTGADPGNIKPIAEEPNEGFSSLEFSGPPLPKLPQDAKVLSRDILLGKILNKPK